MLVKAQGCLIIAAHLTEHHFFYIFSFLSNHFITTSTTPPHPTSQFSGLTREQPHPTSKKSRLFENHPTPPHLKSRWLTNHPTPPQENRDDFETTPPHLKKIEVVLKQPHLEGGVVEVIYNPGPRLERLHLSGIKHNTLISLEMLCPCHVSDHQTKTPSTDVAKT